MTRFYFNHYKNPLTQQVRCSPNSKSETPLHIAAVKNRFGFIARLLKYEKESRSELGLPEDAPPCIQRLNNNGHTPLFSALLSDHLQSVEVLAKDPGINYTFQDDKGNSAFHICAQFNNVESLRYIFLMSIQGVVDKNICVYQPC
jgi:ankyrin repeat protein